MANAAKLKMYELLNTSSTTLKKSEQDAFLEHDEEAAKQWRSPRSRSSLARKSLFGITAALLALYVLFGSPGQTKQNPPIPNIAHFVHLNQANQPLRFQIDHFLVYYSAYKYMKPDVLNIYTNVNESVLEEARSITSDDITRSVFKIPSLKFNIVDINGKSPSGKTLTGGFAHEADFIRAKAMVEQGGVYMDEDMYLIRNIDDLRHSNFQNILGKQWDGRVGNAMLMARPNNRLLTAFGTLQDVVYDGRWSTHSVELLRDLARVFSSIQYEVLVFDTQVFYPFRYDGWGLDKLFRIHTNITVPFPPAEESTSWNNTKFVETFNYTSILEVDYPTDWSETRSIHGWHNALRGINAEFRKELFGDYGGVTIEYLLAANSNFARGLYPALRSALDSGVLTLPSSVNQHLM